MTSRLLLSLLGEVVPVCVKRNRAAVPVETRSVRQYLQDPNDSSPVFQPSHTSAAKPTLSSAQVPVVRLVHMSTADLFTNSLSSCNSPQVAPRASDSSCASVNASASSVTASTSSIGLVVGSSINITTAPLTPTFPSMPTVSFNGTPQTVPYSARKKYSNPFILKFKTQQIKVCQACRKDYDGVNDTMGLVVARAERRIISNLATGVQFMRESNSHYHAHMSCLKHANPTFQPSGLIIPDSVKVVLTPIQKLFLISCFQVQF